MKRITLSSQEGAIVEDCDRLEIHLHEGGIIQRGENSFLWYRPDPIPFSDGSFTSCVVEGYADNLDEAMRCLIRAAMS
ncbi:MAG: hypothetical protein EAZ73_09115 [Oscillatoriales cyanobacterium]|uniref:hypothetical protein n=1 Tax=unclassified Microcoleus TaxID=2642155 RepID=UPI001D34C52C|nr:MULTISPECIES: hypothetical protein [unclassified Microcoleus]MCC3478231.1 hypothetical protein [Microcoleus sp. PH2017_12_PCY_D_A]TAF21377.1 MAG: hypothetical protein EAZ73_09115 [Oscillatoriales cyanobacterium]TAF39696.1 MAG: hypothetical protein EAZ69_00230 [Oscillatoriales cyanobacterium]